MQRLEPLISAQELAEYLDVPVATIYAWRYRGQGPPGLRVGKHLRYRSIDVDEWIESRLEDSKQGFNPVAVPAAAINIRRVPHGGGVG
ncbi:MAG: helix-turn-helix domain-containing protein [Acidimicrobiia bacterium]